MEMNKSDEYETAPKFARLRLLSSLRTYETHKFEEC
jgi:hypothetical protein